MMSDKPELIVFSQYLLGGGASFHRNMLANMPENDFDLKVIYHLPSNGNFAKSFEFVARPNDTIFEYGNCYEGLYSIAKRLSAFISNKPGAIVANLPQELHCLNLFPKSNKTVYFICHDDGFLPLVKKFNHIIDVFIAHNEQVFEAIKRFMPARQSDVYFVPHGVVVQSNERLPNYQDKLKIAFLARHHVLKGLYDLPKINQILLDQGVSVDWIVMGDGPERADFKDKVSDLDNFLFKKPETNKGVLLELKGADIFILPSRKDGLPVALLESMSVGCVPIVSNFSEGIKKVVTNEIGFVVPVGNNRAFADAINQLHYNRDLLGVLSRRAILTVQQHFDIKKRANDYFFLYSNYQKYKKLTTQPNPTSKLKMYYFLRSIKVVVFFQSMVAKFYYCVHAKFRG